MIYNLVHFCGPAGFNYNYFFESDDGRLEEFNTLCHKLLNNAVDNELTLGPLKGELIGLSYLMDKVIKELPTHGFKQIVLPQVAIEGDDYIHNRAGDPDGLFSDDKLNEIRCHNDKLCQHWSTITQTTN